MDLPPYPLTTRARPDDQIGQARYRAEVYALAAESDLARIDQASKALDDQGVLDNTAALHMMVSMVQAHAQLATAWALISVAAEQPRG
jgi:hypothetical protein